jgi:hypothetical protein
MAVVELSHFKAFELIISSSALMPLDFARYFLSISVLLSSMGLYSLVFLGCDSECVLTGCVHTEDSESSGFS